MIHKQQPTDFNPKFEVTSCFIEYEEKILLLHRQDEKSEGDTWGMPAGKVEKNEDNLLATLREVKEETGIILHNNQLNYFRKLFVRYPNYDFIYHIYHARLVELLKISLNPNEHKNFKWVTPSNALHMNLIQDLDTCIRLFYNDKLQPWS